MNETPTNHDTESARRSDTAPLGSIGTPTQSTSDYPPYTPPTTPSTPPQYQSPPETPAHQTYRPNRPIEPPRRMGAPLAGPVILIGAGIVLLLNNLDILPWAIWGDLWRLWPLALIAIGLDLIIGRRKPMLSLLIILLVVGVGGALILYTGFATRGNLTTYNLNVPSTNAKAVSVEVDFGSGELHIDGATNSETLASGSLDYYANRKPPVADLNDDADRADLTINSPSDSAFNFDWFGQSQTPRWLIHLSPRVPISLNADLGTGNSTLDLSALNLTDLDINSGTGNTTVTFPKPQTEIHASIDGGVGNLHLSIPDGTAARISIDTGIGNVTTDPRFTKQGEDTYETANYATSTNKLDLKIDAGVGNVEITK